MIVIYNNRTHTHTHTPPPAFLHTFSITYNPLQTHTGTTLRPSLIHSRLYNTVSVLYDWFLQFIIYINSYAVIFGRWYICIYISLLGKRQIQHMCARVYLYGDVYISFHQSHLIIWVTGFPLIADVCFPQSSWKAVARSWQVWLGETTQISGGKLLAERRSQLSVVAQGDYGRSDWRWCLGLAARWTHSRLGGISHYLVLCPATSLTDTIRLSDHVFISIWDKSKKAWQVVTVPCLRLKRFLKNLKQMSQWQEEVFISS